MHAHLLYTPDADHLDYLHSVLSPAVTLTVGDTPNASATILVSGRPTREQLTACPDARMLVIPFAGLPASTRDLMQEFPQIAVYNSHHNAPMTAEMAFALLLAVAKRLIPIHNTFRRGDWRPRFDAPRNVHLQGKTALILGYGAIGERIGHLCAAFDMTVRGIRRGDDPRDHIYTLDDLPELLPQADVLFACLPATPATKHLIDADVLARLPQGSIVINVGRAAVIDAQALYDALKSGHLYGAGMDVWYNYPPDEPSRAQYPPADVPFGELDNMVMSPHRAGGFGADEVERARMDAIADLINSVAAGDPLPNRIDLSRGY